MTNLTVDQVWRHKKRGSLYRIVATGVRLQCATMPVIEELTGDLDWVMYASENDAHVYTRLESEFLDGRFELVDTP